MSYNAEMALSFPFAQKNCHLAVTRPSLHEHGTPIATPLCSQWHCR